MNLSSFHQQGGSGLFTRGRRVYCNPHVNLSFYVPEGVTKIFAFALGAGGGGKARRGNNDEYCATGGAGGGYASGIISGLTPGNTITCTIGAGGVGDSPSTSVGAGGTTSFGSYLTANGGGAGIQHNTYSSNYTYATKSGQGGSASTSGVTQAITHAGGGTSPGYTDTSNIYGYRGGAGGGASSGSPWGPGTSIPSITGQMGVGGAGWGSNMHQNAPVRGFMSSSASAKWAATAGDGSHGISSQFNGLKYDNWMNGGNGKGGNGLTARGGSFTARSQQFTVEGNNSIGAQGTSSDLHNNGENGNPNWWFPWEIDGGGGGSRVMMMTNNGDKFEHFVRGGDGGPGAGGGACSTASATDGAMYYEYNSKGGDGGIGGGGGGNYSKSNSTSDGGYPAGRTGGHGGFGGGGGGIYTYTNNDRGSNNTYQAGNGGNGLIIVYW